MGQAISTAAEFWDVWPDLRRRTLIGIDLRRSGVDWSEAAVQGAVFLGCCLDGDDASILFRRGALLLPEPDGVPFKAYRSELYSYEELMSGYEDGGWDGTLDARIGAWFAKPGRDVSESMVRALHDATIEAAVASLVTGRRVVGVMGGHALTRDDVLFHDIARLGRSLARAGYCVATGGGPGVMEAANLGAWMAPFPDETLDAALCVLAEAPSHDADPDGFIGRALEVRTRWPEGGVSIGLPTWVYVDEPTTGFASHIAKYFTNSVREDGLLAIARSGVVYAPGGAGTEQEIFTDAGQNSLTLYQVRSPMAFFDRQFFEVDHPQLVSAVRQQAESFGWSELVGVFDHEPSAIVSFINAHDPDAAGAAGVERRRAHRDR